jgi:hypothetical protein
MGVKSGDKVVLCPIVTLAARVTCFLNQVLLPEYGGMQVKIDDKELFMFRSIGRQLCVYSLSLFFHGSTPLSPPAA